MASAEAPHADLLLTGGVVYTADRNRPHAEAVAIRGGRIAALGSAAALHKLRGPATRVIDLAGRMVMPGLIDGHCHPVKGALAELFSCQFAFDATPDEIARALADYAARHPELECIQGGRWGSGFFDRHPLPSPRAWLDRRSAGRAVYLRDDSGHNGWANSKALEQIGFDRNTPDPPGGTVVRDAATGEPSGLLLEAADVVARGRLPDWGAEQYRSAVLEMVRKANGYGIVGVSDADASEAVLQALQEVDREGALTLYVAACITTPYGRRTTPLACDRVETLRDRYASPRVDTRFAKIYEDGVPTAARSAAMLRPYVPDARFGPDFRGVLHVDEATLATDLAALEARGFAVKLHTAGDRAVRTALGAIERAHQISGRSDARHQLAHAGFVDPEDIPRFRQLNAAADLSPYLWYPSPLLESVAGALGERARSYWPIRDLLEAGAPMLAGSDWPAAAASMDPWVGIAALVSRRDPLGRTPGSLWPEQAIRLEEALRIFTIDGARALRRETETGSLEVGKSADLIVLEKNLFQAEPEEIATTVVDLTLFGGEVVHGA